MMFIDFYGSFGSLVFMLFIWWIVLLLFQRMLARRAGQRNSWKRDSIVAFIQSLVVLSVFPLIDFFVD